MSKFWRTIGITIWVIVIIGPLAVAFYSYIGCGEWPLWTGFGEYYAQDGDYERSKTLWDIWELLVMPIAFSGVAFLFNQAVRKSENKIASDRLQEAALESYFVWISMAI